MVKAIRLDLTMFHGFFCVVDLNRTSWNKLLKNYHYKNYFFENAFIIQSNTTDPTNDTSKLHKLKPVTPCPPMILNKNPPMNPPIIPTNRFLPKPIFLSLPVKILASQPAKPPIISQLMIPIFSSSFCTSVPSIISIIFSFYQVY